MTYKRTARNKLRAQWADKAVVEFAKATGMEWEEDQTRLADLLADLMHWAKQREKRAENPVNFSAAFDQAQRHFNDESNGREI